MTIAEAREKCKGFVAKIPRDMLIIGILVLACSLSFWFGYLAGWDVGQKGSIAPESALQQAPTSVPTLEVGTPTTSVGEVIASKNGTKYYLPECTGANRISAENKVWFASPAAATDAGYSPAANCKGI